MAKSCNAISLYLFFNEIITTSWFNVRWLIAANLIHRRLWCLYKWNKNERWTSCMWQGIGRCLISKRNEKTAKVKPAKTKHNLMTSPAIGVSNCWNCLELMAVVSYLFFSISFCSCGNFPCPSVDTHLTRDYYHFFFVIFFACRRYNSPDGDDQRMMR